MATINSLTFNFEPYDLYGSFFESVVGIELARRGLHHTFHSCFGYLPDQPKVFDRREVLASELDHQGKVLRELRGWDAGVIEIKIDRTPETRQRIEVWGYFDTREAATACLCVLTTHLPAELGKLDDETVSVNFWNAATEYGRCRPHRESQTMIVPAWETIARNYPDRVRPELTDLMSLRDSSNLRSRLMLWRGLPGTGKTWAVRALMREWLDWCTFHYVVDPAVFFTNSAYMLSQLSKIGEVGQDQDSGRNWRLIILEDAGEFIAMDSRHQHGQGLAKLLNLCDGLLGQGQKLLFLITTNEEVRNLHPAIVRHGRCLTNLEFPEFSEEEALEWLESHGSPHRPALKGRTLSDLFAACGTEARIVNEGPMKRVGFVR